MVGKLNSSIANNSQPDSGTVEWVASVETLRGGDPVIKPRLTGWDSFQVQPGPNPLPLSDGNLLMLYSGAELVPQGDGEGEPFLRFGVGAVILDRKDPSTVLYRTAEPLVEPEEDWQQCAGAEDGVTAAQRVAVTGWWAVEQDVFRLYVEGCEGTVGEGRFDVDIIGWEHQQAVA